jgi:hypothetical protein
MYISHKHKFAFLRVPKTASSSLSEFFIRNIDDPDAIYTEVDDIKLPARNLPHGIKEKYKQDYAYFHLTLDQIYDEGLITADQIRSYKIIAIMREPIDRHLSFYHFYRKWESKGKPSKKELEQMAGGGYFTKHKNSMIPQSDFLTFRGELVGEYIPYDNFEPRVNEILTDMGIEVKHPMPKHKSGFRKSPSFDLIDEAMQRAIKNRFSRDFEIYRSLK